MRVGGLLWSWLFECRCKSPPLELKRPPLEQRRPPHEQRPARFDECVCERPPTLESPPTLKSPPTLESLPTLKSPPVDLCGARGANAARQQQRWRLHSDESRGGSRGGPKRGPRGGTVSHLRRRKRSCQGGVGAGGEVWR